MPVITDTGREEGTVTSLYCPKKETRIVLTNIGLELSKEAADKSFSILACPRQYRIIWNREIEAVMLFNNTVSSADVSGEKMKK